MKTLYSRMLENRSNFIGSPIRVCPQRGRWFIIVNVCTRGWRLCVIVNVCYVNTYVCACMCVFSWGWEDERIVQLLWV